MFRHCLSRVRAALHQEILAYVTGCRSRVIARGVDLTSPAATRRTQRVSAADLALGHDGARTTVRHYIQAEGIVAEAMDALPQPAAFCAGIE